MEKPISIKVQELEENLVKTLNESNLPAFIIEPIIKDLYEQIIKLKQTQYEKDKADYEKSLNEQIEKGENNE